MGAYNASSFQMFDVQLKALHDVMKGCVLDSKDVLKRLAVWRSAWKTEEVAKAPKKVNTLLPFVLKLVNSELSEADRKTVEDFIMAHPLTTAFFPDAVKTSGGKDLPAGEIFKLVSFLDFGFFSGSCGGEPLEAAVENQQLRVLLKDIDMSPEEKDVVNAYYPNPLLEHLDFQDCMVDEVSERAVRRWHRLSPRVSSSVIHESHRAHVSSFVFFWRSLRSDSIVAGSIRSFFVKGERSLQRRYGAHAQADRWRGRAGQALLEALRGVPPLR